MRTVPWVISIFAHLLDDSYVELRSLRPPEYYIVARPRTGMCHEKVMPTSIVTPFLEVESSRKGVTNCHTFLVDGYDVIYANEAANVPKPKAY
eukprot:scaffold1770_cov64-Cyclotella_meneghiniana.AAC.1